MNINKIDNIQATANTLKNIECSSGFFDRLNKSYDNGVLLIWK